MLGQREAGDRPKFVRQERFDNEQRAAIEGLRFVPLYAARGFLSPGFERHLARHVDRETAVVGPIAAERYGPNWSSERP